ncbi:Signal transduction histidine kinase [Sinosporangium album]|uniref:histidine kinase n=1 Tax=Sinosporangium album TaxID=504805 RepID=A0A1G7Z258_9ACTN|nr:ATP-binding protein [Sinosporangium album]SDH02655.1 Signal transduction histidine kinase [Sinosporangium album]
MIRRLLLSHLSIALLFLVLLEFPLGYLYIQQERERAITEVEHQAEALAVFADEAIRISRMDQLAELVSSNSRRINAGVVIVDPAGRVIVSSRTLADAEKNELPQQPDIKAILNDRQSLGRSHGEIDGVPHVNITVPLGSAVTVHGAVRLTVREDSLGVDVSRVWMSLSAIDLVLLAGVFALVVVLVRWVRKPVRELEKATKRLADGQGFKPASVLTGPPELRQLAVTFNGMASRLQQLIASQRAFAAEASHQLKTPLAALRLRLETLEPYIALRARHNLEAALAETDRLARMVDGLLAMAAFEESSLVREPVDLDALVYDRAQTWAPVVARSGVNLTVSGTRIGEVWAVPGAIEQIIDNLLANALRVSPKGSTITLERRWQFPGKSRRYEGAAELHVIDQGPGMSEEHRQRAFERFWRAPGSGKDGTGLGLAIVQQLTRAGGGEVFLLPAVGTGLDVVIALLPVHDETPRQSGEKWGLFRRLFASRGRHSATGRKATSCGGPGDTPAPG